DMAVITWFFGQQQAVPDNYGHFEVPDDEITFFTFGGNNYRQLMRQKADEMDGRAFITEYAAPTSETDFVDPLLQELNGKHKYLTRLNTVISPDEMTVDPIFNYEDRPNVFNIHDLSNSRGQYDCEREQAANGFVQTFFDNQNENQSSNQDNGFLRGLIAGVSLIAVVLLIVLIIGGAFYLGRRSNN
ncbi:MAG: DUF2330 domain-containing protein, partial [Chloroflexi bacterium]|nr:DUF2330 domain-containing protein [Chloroflexota bacterium]